MIKVQSVCVPSMYDPTSMLLSPLTYCKTLWSPVDPEVAIVAFDKDVGALR